ncbi:hypothetical protein NC652_031307 [Populus alba x Populus x berolinensis]|nr:hypothetical protein NC652_031307 [Populus alba x Populus x berolinensis]
MDEVGSNELDEPSIPWRPRQLAFGQYRQESEPANKEQILRVVVRRPLVARLTKDIVETYQTCNPQFKYSEELNPKRYLTSPSAGVLNDGHDNVNSDLILTVNFALVNLDTQRRYELIKLNQFRGLSLSIVQLFSKQILRGLALLKDAGIIHCDLKPENILLCTRGQPPDYVLKEAKNVSKFFKCIGSVQNLESGEVSLGGRNAYQALTVEEYEARERKKPSIGKEYFHHMNLEAIVTNYPYRKNLPLEDMKKESQIRLALIDFLRGLVEFDPAKRWSPFQASKHPFVTGEPFTCPYKPPLETPRMNHGRARVSLHNSPHFQAVPYGHGTSYGSVGSHGSYNDGIGLGSSYGSYGDGSNMFAYYSPVAPSGMNMHPQTGLALLGSSPDARWRFIQYSHGNGLGMSPSAGNFAPLPLGTSPSQFTPPSSYSQASAGSPGHYGPTSPARSCSHGSPLGKMAAVTQFNRRKSWGHSGSYQSQDCTSSNWQGQSTDGACSNQSEENPSVLGSSPSHRQSSWMQQQGGSGSAAGPSTIQSIPGSFKPAPNMKCPQSAGPIHDKLEASLSLPDPGDWDPNYSDELLLQEDGSDVSSISTEFSNSMHLGSGVPVVGVGRPNRASNASSSSSNQRNGPFHAFSHVDAGSPPSAHDLHAGYGRSMSKPSYFTPHISQNSPSRLGQQPLQRSSHGRPTVRGSEWNHIKVQPPSSFNSGGQRSPGSSSLNNSD